ncbi:squalene/phytoene synthase family protein [Albibacillus kandeliae]|uniref:squalene/phytoene synthase family protein n=1 Tax=Albibacillus kandeliae TaxID=2174228 RepID=UPI000D69F94A|nr:squalene/phytoene synthase family protein [Albibacillus kandeliae]
MSFDANLTACAALVERADPDRFCAAMAAPVRARRVLFPLYAMNVEISRAPWVTAEAMIAEMRLQWWRDALGEIAGREVVRRHEVVTPLAEVLDPELAALLDETVAVRRWDIYRDPFEDAGHFRDYIDRSSGSLFWVAAASLGAAEEGVVRDFGWGVGVANWLVAVPELEARHRVPLLDGTEAGVRALAGEALERLEGARRQRSKVSAGAAAALISGWQARTLLRQAEAEPGRVAAGALGVGPVRSRVLLVKAASGRW